MNGAGVGLAPTGGRTMVPGANVPGAGAVARAAAVDVARKFWLSGAGISQPVNPNSTSIEVNNNKSVLRFMRELLQCSNRRAHGVRRVNYRGMASSIIHADDELQCRSRDGM